MPNASKSFVVTLFDVMVTNTLGPGTHTTKRSRMVFVADRFKVVKLVEEHCERINAAGGQARFDLAKPLIRCFLEETADSLIVMVGPGKNGAALCAYVDPCEVA